jgi:hypothetical protein
VVHSTPDSGNRDRTCSKSIDRKQPSISRLLKPSPVNLLSRRGALRDHCCLRRSGSCSSRCGESPQRPSINWIFARLKCYMGTECAKRSIQRKDHSHDVGGGRMSKDEKLRPMPTVFWGLPIVNLLQVHRTFLRLWQAWYRKHVEHLLRLSSSLAAQPHYSPQC